MSAIDAVDGSSTGIAICRIAVLKISVVGTFQPVGFYVSYWVNGHEQSAVQLMLIYEYSKPMAGKGGTL